MASLVQALQAPVRDRSGRFSWLKAATLILLLIPAFKFGMRWTASAQHLSLISYVYRTGVWATGILLLSLAVTPARKIFGVPQLITVRRMIGLIGLFYTGLHFLAYLALCLFQLPFILQGFTDPSLVIGTVSTLGFVALGLTSFDAAVAWLGGRRWLRLHSFIYLFTALALLHFLLSKDSIGGVPFLMTGIFFWLMAWRVLERFGKGAEPRALLVLAVGVTAFTLAFEVAWVALYQGVSAADTLSYTFAFQYDPDIFDPGIDSTWQLLMLALIPALLPTAIGKALRAGRGLASTGPAEIARAG